MLAGTADDQRWDTDLVAESGALLGYRVSLAPEQNLLDRLLLVHDNIKELMRLGSVSGSDNHILCIDPLLDLRKGITSAPGELSSSLQLQSDNLSVAKDAILVASSQVCHGEQTPKMQ
ncbi:hypothetical protein [Teredinibacter purpureus]|uniref:hypothetical protein n=1 Tax=Teredinibacter purpureus TaxID=2731756 RepID=UPI0005F7B0AE|nr:hypothetical protein [Teredinibacter purpureus]